MYCCVLLDWSAHCLGAASNNTTGTHLICLSVEATCCGVMRTYCRQNSRRHITMQPFQHRDKVWSSRSGALTDLLGTVMLEGTEIIPGGGAEHSGSVVEVSQTRSERPHWGSAITPGLLMMLEGSASLKSAFVLIRGLKTKIGSSVLSCSYIMKRGPLEHVVSRE